MVWHLSLYSPACMHACMGVPWLKRPQTSPIVSWLRRNACVDVLLHFYCLQASIDLGRDVEGLAGMMPEDLCVSL